MSSSLLGRHGGKFATGGALAVASYLYLSRPTAPGGEPVAAFRTSGVQNIEEAYSKGGATPTHTKAYGGTEQGNKNSIHLREGGGTGVPSKESPFQREGTGDDQKPGPTTAVGEAFDRTQYGSKSGK